MVLQVRTPTRRRHEHACTSDQNGAAASAVLAALALPWQCSLRSPSAAPRSRRRPTRPRRAHRSSALAPGQRLKAAGQRPLGGHFPFGDRANVPHLPHCGVASLRNARKTRKMLSQSTALGSDGAGSTGGVCRGIVLDISSPAMYSPTIGACEGLGPCRPRRSRCSEAHTGRRRRACGASIWNYVINECV